MLSRIFIQNFALIDTLEIAMDKGLQVITGETGAGKSIILGALRLILGERADAKSAANPETKSIVEAEFGIHENLKIFFEDNDLDFEEQTVIRREILPTGKSRAFVNDVPVTLDVLKSLSTRLIDIHSQFETSNLFNEEYQFKIIDGLAGNRALIADYQKELSVFKNLNKTLATLKNRLSEGNKEADYKDFLLNELVEADLDMIDMEELQSQLETHENVGHISENLSVILARFDTEEIGVLDGLIEVHSRLGKTAELSHQFTEIHQRFESTFLELKDILFELQNQAEEIETDPSVLEMLTSKFNLINNLYLKHQVKSVEDLRDIRDALSYEQGGFADLENEIAIITKTISEKEKSLEILAQKLSDNRKKCIPVFTKKIEDLLRQLGLEKAKIAVELSEDKAFNDFGKENIAILFQANSGFPLMPIQSAISGGERSRVMLAVKKIMAENSDLPTLILDEIDTGVSGKVADEMGKVMREMSKDMQLIVITHLAQVAAKGDSNYKVVKEDVDGKSRTTILPLSPADKLHEIAQLLSGAKVTDAAMEQARELIG